MSEKQIANPKQSKKSTSVFEEKLNFNRIENKILNFREQQARSLHKIEQQKKNQEFKLWIKMQKQQWQKEKELWKNELKSKENEKHMKASKLKINPIMQNNNRLQCLTTKNKKLKESPFYDKRYIDIGDRIRATELLKQQEHDQIITEKLKGKQQIKSFHSSRIQEVNNFKNQRMENYKQNMSELQDEMNSLQGTENNLLNKLKSTESSVQMNGSYLSAAKSLNPGDFSKKYLNKLKQNQNKNKQDKFLLNLEEQQQQQNQQAKGSKIMEDKENNKQIPGKETFITNEL